MLSEFIQASGKSRAYWAARFEISTSFLSQLTCGRKVPSLHLGVRIDRATDGAVPVASWVADTPDPLKEAS